MTQKSAFDGADVSKQARCQPVIFKEQFGKERPLIAYHGNSDVKAGHVAKMRDHVKNDGSNHYRYLRGGKSCSFQCITSDCPGVEERKLGWPSMMEFLEERIVDGMTLESCGLFPLRLLEAVPVGFSDWDVLYHDFCVFALRGICKFDRKRYPSVADAVDRVIALHEARSHDREAWLDAKTSAGTWSKLSGESAQYAAKAATEAAARGEWPRVLEAWSSSFETRAASVATDAAASAAEPAEWAATAAPFVVRNAAGLAAESAAWSAAQQVVPFDAEPAAGSPWDAVWASAHDRMADWLVRWFKEAGRSV